MCTFVLTLIPLCAGRRSPAARIDVGVWPIRHGRGGYVGGSVIHGVNSASIAIAISIELSPRKKQEHDAYTERRRHLVVQVRDAPVSCRERCINFFPSETVKILLVGSALSSKLPFSMRLVQVSRNGVFCTS